MKDLERIVRLCGGEWPREDAKSLSLRNNSTAVTVHCGDSNLPGAYTRHNFYDEVARLRKEYEYGYGVKPVFKDWLTRGLNDGQGVVADAPVSATIQPQNKYQRTIKPTLPCNTSSTPLIIDVYDVIDAYEVTSPELQHAIKKLLAVGIRGHKSAEQDLQDIIDSVERAKQRLAVS